MARKKINNTTTRFEIDTFGKINRREHPTKMPDEDFYTKENLINKVGTVGSIEKRNGIQQHNTNTLSSDSIVNLYETRIGNSHRLLGKDNAPGTAALLKYCSSPFTGSWTSVATTEEEGRYHFQSFKDNVYIGNRILTSSAALQYNKVWTGGSALYEHGCVPFESDFFTVIGASGISGDLENGYYYFYVVTYLIDGYQESSCMSYLRVDTTGYTATYVQSLNSYPSYTGVLGRIVAKKIYRSTALAKSETSIPEYMYYLTTITNSSVTEFLDVRGDDTLGTGIPIETLFDQKRPYKSKYFTVAQNRLIQANLEINSSRYSAVSTSDVTLTPSTSGGSMLAGYYSYKIYKCYFYPSGGRFGFKVGSEVTKETQITSGIAGSVQINVTNTEANNDYWLGYYLIMRSKVSATTPAPIKDYLYVGTVIKSTTYTDTYADSSLVSAAKDFPIDIIYADELNTTYKYKNLLAISEVGKGDLIPESSLKVIGAATEPGITGVFTEDSRVIIFKATDIYGMDTRPSDSSYWTVDRLVNGIGAKGQWITSTTEQAGHQGILQLPNSGGYVFFSRAYSASATTPIDIYYWKGEGMPEKISDNIKTYINGYSSFNVKGMCYDKVRNWVWAITDVASAKQILVYDIEFKDWYVFPLNSALIFHDVICTEDGAVLFACNGGLLNAYVEGTFQDVYSGANKVIACTLRTKDIEEYDQDLILQQIQVMFETSSAGISLDQSVTTYSQSGTSTNNAQNYTAVSGTIHRSKKRMNYACRKFNLILSNSENNNIIIHKIEADYKTVHEEKGGQ